MSIHHVIWSLECGRCTDLDDISFNRVVLGWCLYCCTERLSIESKINIPTPFWSNQPIWIGNSLRLFGFHAKTQHATVSGNRDCSCRSSSHIMVFFFERGMNICYAASNANDDKVDCLIRMLLLLVIVESRNMTKTRRTDDQNTNQSKLRRMASLLMMATTCYPHSPVSLLFLFPFSWLFTLSPWNSQHSLHCC